jgi:hypothetical protein
MDGMRERLDGVDGLNCSRDALCCLKSVSVRAI